MDDKYKTGDEVAMTIGGVRQQATVEFADDKHVHVIWLSAAGQLERLHVGHALVGSALTRVFDAVFRARNRFIKACMDLDIHYIEHEGAVLSATQEHMVRGEIWEDLCRARVGDMVHSPEYYRFMTAQLPGEQARADDARQAEERAASCAAIDDKLGMSGADLVDALASAAPSLMEPGSDAYYGDDEASS